MIEVTTLGGEKQYLNHELFEKIVLVPDTIIVLINGHKYMVSEAPELIIQRIIEFKKNISPIIKPSNTMI